MGKNGFFNPMGKLGEQYPPFSFRIPGNGTSQSYWRKIIVALSQAGYNGTVSIEHEDDTMSQDEGIRKSVAFLKEILVREQATRRWWRDPIEQYQRTFLPE